MIYSKQPKTPVSVFTEKGTIMDISDGIKKILLAGVGAVAVTGEAAGKLISNLVEKGELTVEQGKALTEEFKKEKEKKDVYSAVEKMSKEELVALRARLDDLEKTEEEPVCETEAEGSCCAGPDEN